MLPLSFSRSQATTCLFQTTRHERSASKRTYRRELRPSILNLLRVLLNLRSNLAEQFDMSVRVRSRMAEAYIAMNTIRSVREQLKSVVELVQGSEYDETLQSTGDSIVNKLTAIEDVLTNTKTESRQDPINFPPLLDNQLGYLYRYVVSAYGRPTRAAYVRLEELEGQLAEQVGELSIVLDEDVARFNTNLQDLGVPGIIVSGARGRANRYPD